MLRALVIATTLVVALGTAHPQDFSTFKLTRAATDKTGTLTGAELERLESILRSFEKSTSTQIVVVLIPSLGERAIEEAAHEIAAANGIGQQGKDNGVLLLVAKDDRQIRIEVGYGLEGVVPDIVAGQIIRNDITPRFRVQDFAGGIEAGVQSIILATKNEYQADEERSGEENSPFAFIFVVFLFFFLSRMFRRRRGFGVTGPWIGGMGGGRGGGGFGGFSGGGGSFGGGGASGRW